MTTSHTSVPPVLLGAVVALMTLGAALDLVMDRPQQWLSFHVVFELLMVVGGLTLIILFWLGWWRAERATLQLQQSVERHRAERATWIENSRPALAGFGEAIDRQFDAWQLTPTEREVALLLLKGRSHKAIAAATARSPATVRQHATSVYQKAGLAGRAELAAFFLEEVALPEAAAGSGP